MKFSFRRGPARGVKWRRNAGRGLLLGAAGLVILLAAFANARHAHEDGRRATALPLILTVVTARPMTRGEVVPHIEPVFVTPEGSRTEFPGNSLHAQRHWSWKTRELVERLEIRIAPGYRNKLDGVRLSVDGRDIPAALSAPERAAADGTKGRVRYRVVVPPGELRRSVLTPGGAYVNRAGDGAVLGRMAAFIALWGGLLGLILFAARLRSLRQVLERRLSAVAEKDEAGGPRPDRPGRPDRGWMWAGLAAVLLTLAALQWRDPFYFTQDDNFAQFLPVILAGGESLLAGSLFDYNPYQLLGAPTVEVGTYALTYPGTYLAFALAQLAGNAHFTLEIFCMGHLVLGFLATFWAARRWGAGGALAAALAVCFVLSGYALVAGRSWYYMTPVFLWLPLALGALHGVLFRERKIGSTLLLGLSLGLLFHAGNVQMWVYAAGLTGALALALWLREGRPQRAFAHLWAAGLGALALAAPLFLLQFGFAAQAARAGGGGFSVTHSLTSLFVPVPLDAADMNFHLAPADLMDLGPFFYSGPLLIPAGLLVAALAASWLWRTGRAGAVSAAALFGFAGTVSLLFALGYDGPVWFLHAAMPVFAKFTHPLKWLPFAVLLLGLAAIIAWERLNIPERTRRRGAALFALGAFGLMFWNAMRTHELAIHYYKDDPYPGVETPVTAPRRHEARLFPLSPLRSTRPGFTESENLNFAMLHRELSLWGYDPIVSNHPGFRKTLLRLLEDPAPLLREYGVRRIVLWQEKLAPRDDDIYLVDRLSPWQANVAGFLRESGVKLADLSGERRVRGEAPVPDAKPLAWVAGDPSRAWPVTAAGPRVSVSFGEGGWPGGELVLGFLAHGRTQVKADGQTASFRADEWGRVVARVPEGAHSVTLGYAIDWLPGLSVAVALLALAAYGVWRFDRQGPARRERL
ncbi:MAG: hypothetical protein ACLFWF_03665 [Alphaproteobacteria bacterium]